MKRAGPYCSARAVPAPTMTTSAKARRSRSRFWSAGQDSVPARPWKAAAPSALKIMFARTPFGASAYSPARSRASSTLARYVMLRAPAQDRARRRMKPNHESYLTRCHRSVPTDGQRDRPRRTARGCGRRTMRRRRSVSASPKGRDPKRTWRTCRYGRLSHFQRVVRSPDVRATARVRPDGWNVGLCGRCGSASTGQLESEEGRCWFDWRSRPDNLRRSIIVGSLGGHHEHRIVQRPDDVVEGF